MVKNLSKKQQKEVKEEINKEVNKQLSKKILQKTTIFGSEFKKHTSTAIIAAFGFIIALAWRDLIVRLIQENLNPSTLDKYPYLDLLITALIVTLVSVIGISIVAKWAKKD